MFSGNISRQPPPPACVCVRTRVCVRVMGRRPVGSVISCSVKGSLVAQGGALLIVVFMSPLLRALADLIS